MIESKQFQCTTSNCPAYTKRRSKRSCDVFYDTNDGTREIFHDVNEPEFSVAPGQKETQENFSCPLGMGQSRNSAFQRINGRKECNQYGDRGYQIPGQPQSNQNVQSGNLLALLNQVENPEGFMDSLRALLCTTETLINSFQVVDLLEQEKNNYYGTQANMQMVSNIQRGPQSMQNGPLQQGSRWSPVSQMSPMFPNMQGCQQSTQNECLQQSPDWRAVPEMLPRFQNIQNCPQNIQNGSLQQTQDSMFPNIQRFSPLGVQGQPPQCTREMAFLPVPPNTPKREDFPQITTVRGADGKVMLKLPLVLNMTVNHNEGGIATVVPNSVQMADPSTIRTNLSLAEIPPKIRIEKQEQEAEGAREDEDIGKTVTGKEGPTNLESKGNRGTPALQIDDSKPLPKPQQNEVKLCTPCTCKVCPVHFIGAKTPGCPENCGCCDCPYTLDDEIKEEQQLIESCNCTTTNPLISPLGPCTCQPNADSCKCTQLAEDYQKGEGKTGPSQSRNTDEQSDNIKPPGMRTSISPEAANSEEDRKQKESEKEEIAPQHEQTQEITSDINEADNGDDNVEEKVGADESKEADEKNQQDNDKAPQEPTWNIFDKKLSSSCNEMLRRICAELKANNEKKSGSEPSSDGQAEPTDQLSDQPPDQPSGKPFPSQGSGVSSGKRSNKSFDTRSSKITQKLQEKSVDNAAKSSKKPTESTHTHSTLQEKIEKGSKMGSRKSEKPSLKQRSLLVYDKSDKGARKSLVKQGETTSCREMFDRICAKKSLPTGRASPPNIQKSVSSLSEKLKNLDDFCVELKNKVPSPPKRQINGNILPIQQNDLDACRQPSSKDKKGPVEDLCANLYNITTAKTKKSMGCGCVGNGTKGSRGFSSVDERMGNIMLRLSKNQPNESPCLDEDVLGDIYSSTRKHQNTFFHGQSEASDEPCGPNPCGNKRITYGYSLDNQLKQYEQKKAASPDVMKNFVEDLCKDLKSMKNTLNRGLCFRNPTAISGCMDDPSNNNSNMPGACLCLEKREQSFPASIRCVRPAGYRALLITWTIHSFCGLAGYEICVDGCLKTRLYSAAHDSGCVFGVDVCNKHIITLHPVPDREHLKQVSKKDNKPELPFKCNLLPDFSRKPSSKPSLPCSWTPSTYLYDPNPNCLPEDNVDDGPCCCVNASQN